MQWFIALFIYSLLSLGLDSRTAQISELCSSHRKKKFKINYAPPFSSGNKNLCVTEVRREVPFFFIFWPQADLSLQAACLNN